MTDAITAARRAQSWYLAKFVSSAGQTGSVERRTTRWALRGLQRQPGISALRRVAACGTPLGGAPVRIKRREDGGGHVLGVETCGSVWSCPVCSAVIRNHRAQEITTGLLRHIGAGGGAAMITLTLPHDVGDALARTVELVSDGFRALQRGRPYRRERDTYGILGHIRTFEVTHGAHGWHPHLHILLVTEAPLSRAACTEIEAAWLARWNRWLSRSGWRLASAEHGVRVDRVQTGAEAVAAYITKVQEGGEHRKVNVASELARADLKRARSGSRAPFEILADLGSDGLVSDLELWHEYQLGTKGRSAIRWSTGLRALLLADEPEMTDEEIAEQQRAGGEVVAVIAAPVYRAIMRRPYGEAYLLVAAETGGLDGVRAYVQGLGLSPGGVYPPEAWYRDPADQGRGQDGEMD